MKASNLVNAQVFLENGVRLRGLVRDIRIQEHAVDCLVLSEGGMFGKGQIVLPGDIIEVDYDHITLGANKSVLKISSKELKKRFKGSYSLMDTPVLDVDGKHFAKVADATISQEFKVLEYDLSRSFFDDMDDGYSLIASEQLDYEGGSIHYHKDMIDTERTNREGGILEKVLGEEFHESITR